MTWPFKTCPSKMWRLASAAIGAALLAVALPALGFAQQSDNSARTAKSDHGAATHQTLKPAKSVARPGAGQAAKAPPAERQWTLQDALPDHPVSRRQYDPPSSPGMGRVPLQSGPGTVGFETKTQINPNQMPDGTTIRGQEATVARSSSYVGMSLSVPTIDKAMNFSLPWRQP